VAVGQLQAAGRIYIKTAAPPRSSRSFSIRSESITHNAVDGGFGIIGDMAARRRTAASSRLTSSNYKDGCWCLIRRGCPPKMRAARQNLILQYFFVISAARMGNLQYQIKDRARDSPTLSPPQTSGVIPQREGVGSAASEELCAP